MEAVAHFSVTPVKAYQPFRHRAVEPAPGVPRCGLDCAALYGNAQRIYPALLVPIAHEIAVAGGAEACTAFDCCHPALPVSSGRL